MGLEELPKGTPKTSTIPVECESCYDIDDIGGRVAHMEKIEQLRREEDAKMSERFTGIKEALTRIEVQQVNDHALILETRDMTLQNNHDLNNGLKSTVKAIARKVGALETAINKHEAEDTPENRELVIRAVGASMDKEKSEGKHRTIEIWAAIIGATVILSEVGAVSWLVGLFR